MSHTPEPWKQHEEDPRAIVAANDPHMSLLTVGDDGMALIYGEEDARRIVACVNACAGIETPDLEVGNAKFIEMLKERSALKQQRDKLLAALVDLVNQPQDITTPAYQSALAVIQECEK